MQLAAKHAIGLTSSGLPLCLVPSKNQHSFLEGLVVLYPTLSKAFIEWLSKTSDLTICWVMGFKPRGDDARPDRGLAPMARMLIGKKSELLTVVYGPASAMTWPLLAKDPVSLKKRNGLWEAILSVSDAVLIDSSTVADLQPMAFLRSHWDNGILTVQEPSRIVVNAGQIKNREHDVDTVLHLLFARTESSQVFEGMCNPPGGDWSGISLQTPDRSLELRWLSLPRVTASDSKRPDHVFEIFGVYSVPIILVIESKERSSSVETNIGQRLIKYVADLISTLPSVQRANSSNSWSHATTVFPLNSVQFASAVAFITSNPDELRNVSKHCATDFVMGFEFNEDCASCSIQVRACTELGRNLLIFMQSIARFHNNITMSESQ